MQPYPYRTLSSQELGRYRIELGELATPEGPSPYSIVRMRGFSCCFVTVEGRLAMVRQYRYSVDSWQLELPAGGIERGETPREAAARELAEEAGLVADELIDLGMVYPSVGSTDERCFIFAGRGTGTCARNFDRGEQAELVLLSRQEVEQMIDDGSAVYPALYVAWLRLQRQGLLDALFC